MADALASGASVRKDVGVQVPPRAPRENFRISGTFQLENRSKRFRQVFRQRVFSLNSRGS
jgi:hypothetical protein